MTSLIKNKNLALSALMIIMMTGCTSVRNWQPSAGPTYKQVERTQVLTEEGVVSALPLVIDIDAISLNHIKSQSSPQRFSDFFSSSRRSVQDTIQAGDVIDVSIWEAPPALLFGQANDSGVSGSREVKLLEQMVDAKGQITIPFVGGINVVGKSPRQVQDMIVSALTRKANKPSAIVRIVKNNTSDITVVGDVNSSVRMPLTGKGERLLDAIAAAGGAKHPNNRVTVRVNRGSRAVTMLLDEVIADARQNIVLQPGDVVSVDYQSNSFTVLGATIKNDEIDFETKGISLMQALARAGGLNDNRADARGVFIFRYETSGALTADQLAKVPAEVRYTNRIPVVYRLDLKDPMNYLIAQQFAINNQDVVYVSNAPAVEFGKFLGMISRTVYSIANIENLTQ